jgi:hypothetical protein
VPDLVVFLAIVGVVAVLGIVVGMLLAPRLDRLTEPQDEDDGGDTD